MIVLLLLRSISSIVATSTSKWFIYFWWWLSFMCVYIYVGSGWMDGWMVGVIDWWIDWFCMFVCFHCFLPAQSCVSPGTGNQRQQCGEQSVCCGAGLLPRWLPTTLCVQSGQESSTHQQVRSAGILGLGDQGHTRVIQPTKYIDIFWSVCLIFSDNHKPIWFGHIICGCQWRF